MDDVANIGEKADGGGNAKTSSCNVDRRLALMVQTGLRAAEMAWALKISIDESGKIVGVVVKGNDVTGLKQAEEQVKSSLREKEVLLQEIHHRVKNNLEIVSSILALQSAQIQNPDAVDALQESQNRVHSMSMIHQKLYQGENLGTIEMKDYFINLGSHILDSFGVEKRITLEYVTETLELDIDTAVPLGLIVNELLTNVMKYSFINKRPVY